MSRTLNAHRRMILGNRQRHVLRQGAGTERKKPFVFCSRSSECVALLRCDIYNFTVVIDSDVEAAEVIASEYAIDFESLQQIKITDSDLDILQLRRTDFQLAEHPDRDINTSAGHCKTPRDRNRSVARSLNGEVTRDKREVAADANGRSRNQDYRRLIDNESQVIAKFFQSKYL